MTRKAIGFIGGGRVTSCLLAGLEAGGVTPKRLVVSDLSPEALAKLRHDRPDIETTVDNCVAASQEYVFLALHPTAGREVLPQIRSVLARDAVVIALAPKLTLAAIREGLGGFDRLVRCIPNVASRVRAGFNPVCFGPGLAKQERADVLRLLRTLGECPEVAEQKLEAFAVLTAMGPTFFWYQLYELLRLAQSFGLSPAEARAGLKEMMTGALQVMLESGLPEEEVQDLVPSRPLAELEPSVLETMRAHLAEAFAKIRPS